MDYPLSAEELRVLRRYSSVFHRIVRPRDDEIVGKLEDRGLLRTDLVDLVPERGNAMVYGCLRTVAEPTIIGRELLSKNRLLQRLKRRLFRNSSKSA